MWRVKLKYIDGTEYKTDRLTLRDILELILVKNQNYYLIFTFTKFKEQK